MTKKEEIKRYNLAKGGKLVRTIKEIEATGPQNEDEVAEQMRCVMCSDEVLGRDYPKKEKPDPRNDAFWETYREKRQAHWDREMEWRNTWKTWVSVIILEIVVLSILIYSFL